MKSKKMKKFLTVAMAAAVLATSLLPPGMAHGAELPVEADADEIPQVGQVVKKHTINVEPSNEESKDPAGKDTYWKLDWSDEFNGNKLDTTKWGYQVGDGSDYGVAGWGNNELEYYTDGDNVSFEDGRLVISAKKSDKGWTSAKLWTKGQEYYDGKAENPLYAKKYGRVEAKMSLPKGTGLWPAFWMMPLDDLYGGWASSGEIDIMEARGRLPHSVDGTIHFGNTAPNNKNRGWQYDKDKTVSENAKNFDFSEEHEYALEWLPGQLKWYVDDECYYTETNWYSTSNNNGDDFTYPAPFDQEFFIMLNLAVGGNYDGGRIDQSMKEAQMKVDYVRVYDLCDDASGTVHDYEKDEQTVTSSSGSGSGALVGGEIGDNFLTGKLKDAQPGRTDDEKATSGDTPLNEGWYLLTGTGGEATVSGSADSGAGEGGVATVNVTNGGENGHSVQFMHQLPLTKGYKYKLQLEAKAETNRNITAQLSDYVYTAFDGSWSKYSDMKTMALTPQWQTFELEFGMREMTDKNTRLEINLGAGSTGNVSFRNATLVATGLDEGKSEDAEKEPVGNGEHIYNGTFDQGGSKDADNKYTRMRFWTLTGGAQGSVTNDRNRSLQLTGTSADAGIMQTNIQMLPNEGYRLAFDVEGSGNVTVKIAGSNGTEYKTEVKAANGRQEVEFDVPGDAAVKYGMVQFLVGMGSVTLDNVSMVKTTNRSTDWSTVDLFLLDNYDFSRGEEGWNVFNYWNTATNTGGWVNNGSASGDGSPYKLDIQEDGLHIDAYIPDKGATTYSVGIETATMDLRALLNYKLRLKVKDVAFKEGTAEKPATLDTLKRKTIGVQMPDGSFEECTFTEGDNGEIVIPFTPKKDIESGKITLHLGQNFKEEYGSFRFVMEYFDFTIDLDNNDVNGMPEEYKTIKRAPEVKSAGGVELGTDVVFTHKSSVWAEAVKEVYLNDKAIASDKVHKEGDKIRIDADVFQETGFCSVRFRAEGYVDVTVSQRVSKAHGNLFPDELRVSYDGKGDGEKGSMSTKSYGFDVNFVETTLTTYDGGATYTPMFWTMQARVDNIVTQQKVYVLEYDAELCYQDPYVSKERGLVVEYGSASKKAGQQTTIKLQPGTKHYRVEMGVGAMDDFYLLFMAGGAELTTAPHTLNVSNIAFSKAGETLYAAVPEIKTQPTGNTYTVGNKAAALTVSAASKDGGSLSYQWFKNSTKQAAGATAIVGATGQSYTPATSAEGTTYYYCKVTNTNKKAYEKQTASLDSGFAAVAVKKKVINQGENPSGKIPSTKVKVNVKKIYLIKGKKIKVKATLTPRNSTDNVTWTSSKKKNVTVTGKKAIATITAKAVSSKPITITAKTASGKKTSFKVYVVDKKKAKKSVSVKLNKKKLTLKEGAIMDLTPTVKPANSTDTVKWNSSNKKVASVDAYGMVTAKKKGKATITVKTSSGKKATCKITVK